MQSNKKVTAKQNAVTGSYTVRVSRSAQTGRFVATPKTSGRIEIMPQTTKKAG